MVQRVAGDLMGMKNVIVINDEAHHCYREKAGPADEGKLSAEEKAEAKANTEAARLWISGIEAVKRKIGVTTVYDLSATPFFLRGSGYVEGTLFPWTMSDFSLMDAIECGIVKLPRVPITDNMAAKDAPIYRELWKHVGKDLPKKGRGAQRSPILRSCRPPSSLLGSSYAPLRPLRPEDLTRLGQEEKIPVPRPSSIIDPACLQNTEPIVEDSL